MKIVGQKIFVANASRTNFVFVKLTTDDGVTGVGEATLVDIKGKALGVPVYELLGGKHRDRLKCYANHWFQGAVVPDDYAAKARAAVKMGFRALKWDPF